MINHLRTVLLNGDLSEAMGDGYPGEEIIGDEARRLLLGVDTSSGIATVWRTLFGSDPDRAHVNWRLYELLHLVHNCPLVQFVKALDSRITYVPYPNISRLVEAPSHRIRTVRGAGRIEVTGVVQEGGATGRIYNHWLLETDTGSLVVIPLLPGGQTYEASLTYLGGVSQVVALMDRGRTSGLSVMVSPDDGSAWEVESLARPVPLATVLDRLESTMREGATGHAALFHGDEEPYRSCKALWNLRQEAPSRLAAVTVALGYRMEEARRARLSR